MLRRKFATLTLSRTEKSRLGSIAVVCGSEMLSCTRVWDHTISCFTLNSKRKSGQDNENYGSHYSSLISVHWPRLILERWLGVAGEVLITVSYSLEFGRSGAE